MKSKLTKLAQAATLGLAITLTLNACEEKGGGNAKLLEAITDENGTFKFEYDKQNRIVKIGDKTITYSDNLITVGTEKYVIKGNTVTFDNKRYTIDKDGYIAVYEEGGERDGHIVWGEGYSAKNTYKDGNLIGFSGEGHSDYSYDDKKSPFSGCTSPKWLIQNLLLYTSASKNNVIKSEGTDEGEKISSTYKYEYDSDGFPVKQTESNNYGNTTTTIFTYRGEPQTATAKTETTAPQAAAKPAENAGGSQPSGEEGCPDKKEPPVTTEAVFLRNSENAEGIGFSTFRLPDGEEAMDFDEHNLQEGDKVSITYKSSGRYDGEDRCYYFKEVISVKKIGQ